MNKIRFVNPILNCLEVQGKSYTVTLIATIVASLLLGIVAAIAKMPICAIVSVVIGIGCIIGFGWWFGTEKVLQEDEEF